ncbi:MAG: ABC-F family ATP-binding cassette domain-containing protein [Planctomycetes bacterium]|nr:ABC-F family ATP-binding cassette domain-containing protein [Planctomycetota bacterium]MBT4027814.1 ABC-F family ATP-binding cassette domain-containing protein [Planctomycetota bacterium]MBT4560415.1 ABC-F family ATP-binding cassette domain-containing protein [Planctomycetota bacterium]MBT5101134.1 ABC-F family ATP-binding cassette domain-containing protein [Planctomycetota bacterium]MBT7318742.1 ABC-F family ATP-binding cassette domain-containing protein [Planctomycetota bacterium]
MLSIQDIDYRYGSQIIYQEASLKVEDNWKVGLIGPNGSGKTTLFRLITGQDKPEAGEIGLPTKTHIGYFDQKVGEMHGCGVVEQAVRCSGRVAELRGLLEKLEHDMGDPDQFDDLDKLMARYSGLQNEFQTLGGYDLEPRAREILGGLGFSEARMNQQVEVLSGGWKMRVSLAGILLQSPEILLLDEPTNHLDLESIIWLENFIRDYRGMVIMTCHDHEFMNRVVDRIVEIDEGRLRLFPGDYDFYLAQREMEDSQRMAAFERQEKQIGREMKFINAFRSKARQASMVQSRIRALGKMDKLEPPRSRKQRLHFRIPPTKRSGNDIFVGEGVEKIYGDNIVLMGVDWHVRRQERWAVMGVNGAGKTTLLKIVKGDIEADGGRAKLGASLQFGYFAQHSTEMLHPEETVINTMLGEFPGESIGSIRKCLACFGFDSGDLDKATSWLSGGEKSRLVLARMLYKPPNLLVLDEPTNHLDVESRQALIDALKSYDGTILFVSHDRHFLDAVATHVIELQQGEAEVFHGGYHAYVERSGHQAPGAPIR